MYTKTFSEVTANDVYLVGGKGASLGEMTRAGIMVPNGFVITTKAHTVSTPDLIAEIYREFDILNCEFVAVRSSANCEDSADNSFAGQFDTFLNITRENLIESVQKCWQGVYSDRCKSYLDEKNIDPNSVEIAVVIQKMIQPEVAGVAFTIHPITNDRNQIYIECALGLGEAVVAGMVTPDGYLYSKQTNKILEVDINTQTKGLFKDEFNQNRWLDISPEKGNTQKLSNPQIIELAQLCLHIEIHYDFPCDIEWCLFENNFYIVQSRPITTNTVTEISNYSKKYIAQRSRHGILPNPAYWNYLSESSRFSELHAYIDESGYFTAFYEESEWQDNEQEVFREIQTNPYYITQVVEAQEKIGQKLLSVIHTAYSDYYTRLDELCDMWVKFDRSQVFAWFLGAEPLHNHLQTLYPNLSQGDFHTMVTPHQITQATNQELEVLFLTLRYQSGETFDDLAVHIHRISQKYFWMSFGYNGPKIQDASFYQDIILENSAMRSQDVQARIEEIQMMSQRVAEKQQRIVWSKDILKEHVRLFEDLRLLTVLQDERKRYHFQLHIAYNDLLKKVGIQKSVDLEWLYYLTNDEIKSLSAEQIEILYQKRKKSVIISTANGVTKMFDSCDNLFSKTKKMLCGEEKLVNIVQDTISGYGASLGKVTGRIQKIFSSEMISEFVAGNILVSGMTSPEFPPAIQKSIAIITDEGGITCHAAIVAREFKKPCIIGTKFATELLNDGDLVEVDANSGVVRILERLITL